MTGLRYFSTFSGIGGFELGIQAAMPDAECVGFSEIDKYAASVYQHHFTEARNYGDIKQINPGQLEAFDLFVGGFPCQAFSVAGKRLGFDDTRGTLFFEVARILKAKRPRHLVLENVKGLLSHDGGKTFATILGVLTDLGYFVEWQVLNSKDFGVPQNRERVYIVGHLGSAPQRKVFPIVGEDKQVDQAESSVFAVAQRGRGGIKDTVQQLEPRYDGVTNTLTAVQKDNMVLVREATSKGYAEATVGDTINISVPTSKTRRGRVQKGLAGTLQTSENQVVMHPMVWERTETGKQMRREAQAQGRDYTPFNGEARRLAPSDKPYVGTLTSQAISKDSLIGNEFRIRRLTPRECERLQGFPDDWTKLDRDGKEVSDTQRYKMCGNAVTTNVVTAVMERLLNDGH